MSKQRVVIISIFSTVLSLIWILLTYFGIIRYISIHVRKNESFIQNYHKLEKGDDKHRIVISITTNSKNIKHLTPVITSLLDQTVKVDEIALTIPYGKEYEIPNNIKDVVKVYRVYKKYENASNIIPSILREGESDTKIIFVSDNIIYGRDFIEDILISNKKHPGSILTHKNKIVYIEPNFYDYDVCEYELGADISDWMIKKCKNKSTPIELKYTENYKAYYDW
jgi:hypothetical protein